MYFQSFQLLKICHYQTDLIFGWNQLVFECIYEAIVCFVITYILIYPTPTIQTSLRRNILQSFSSQRNKKKIKVQNRLVYVSLFGRSKLLVSQNRWEKDVANNRFETRKTDCNQKYKTNNAHKRRKIIDYCWLEVMFKNRLLLVKVLFSNYHYKYYNAIVIMITVEGKLGYGNVIHFLSLRHSVCFKSLLRD